MASSKNISDTSGRDDTSQDQRDHSKMSSPLVGSNSPPLPSARKSSYRAEPPANHCSAISGVDSVA
jgi:hypothetical protein